MTKPDAIKVERLNLKEGDILVFRATEDLLTHEQIRNIEGSMLRALGEAGRPDIPIIVLDKSAVLEVVRPTPGKSPYIARSELVGAVQEAIDRGFFSPSWKTVKV